VEQHRWLSLVLTGHYRYFGVPSNYKALAQFRYRVREIWHRALVRRSQRARWTYARRKRFDQRFQLPKPRIFHPWPQTRFALR
jgi:RNA-directed DNA polymerase